MFLLSDLLSSKKLLCKNNNEFWQYINCVLPEDTSANNRLHTHTHTLIIMRTSRSYFEKVLDAFLLNCDDVQFLGHHHQHNLSSVTMCCSVYLIILGLMKSLLWIFCMFRSNNKNVHQIFIENPPTKQPTSPLTNTHPDLLGSMWMPETWHNVPPNDD